MSGKKIGIIGSVLVVIAGLSYLALGNFGENLVYFMTPSEVVTLEQDLYGKKMRVAGMVVEASMKVVPETLKISFDLTDGAETIPVAFEGIPPDLFKEGKGAVVEGYWDKDQIFHSHMIMAKHEEDYMPIEMKNAGESLPTLGLLKTLHVEK
ncbi:Cytochrome c-type biogenesis protein CcmE, heme chaperone [hydrothermal vent metagenome]|uniref:Cytochrome c-type biogenesis protein CcmE, heme chaperone n=1 Tax=hydrothermal vent metagenome TaxID=652676 RepID=A0A3B1D2F4_9ZZZZ